MKNILVTGATGSIGRQVVAQLLAHNLKDVRIRAMARNPESAGLPPTVEVMPGDLNAPATLDQCLDGIDAVFLMWHAPDTSVAPALERIAQHGRQIVCLSNATVRDDAEEQNFPVTALHAKIERLIAASGVPWTFLRPGAFASNAALWWAAQIRAGDVVRWPFPEAVLSPIHEADIAAVGVRALCEDGHAGAKYILTGPEALTQREQVQIIGEALDRPLRFEEIGPETARREMLKFTSPEIADMLLQALPATIGRPPLVTARVSEVTGVPARSFRDWVVDHAAEFSRA
jgi:uncharacterized protein YbjT (DUF2867 family)